MKAVWNGVVIARSDDTVVVEGNHYFPLSSVDPRYLRPSASASTCHWKGQAGYHSLQVDDAANPDAVWFYADPLPAAEAIRGRVAFWKGVQVLPD